MVIVPTWGLKDHVTAVFEVPLTKGVKVAVWPPVSDALPGETLRLADVSLMLAVAVLVESTTLAAVSVTVCELLIEAGAVYTPFTIVPAAGFKDQVTAVLLVPVTVAAKVADPPSPSDTEAGPTVTPTGCNDTMALADLVESATLVAVTVTACWLAIIAGA